MFGPFVGKVGDLPGQFLGLFSVGLFPLSEGCYLKLVSA